MRYVEQRRGNGRGDRAGRRASDGRSWFDGGIDNAIRGAGWVITPDGQHVCPHCYQKTRMTKRPD
ncbi:MAG: hypothetical protein DRQ37_04555 [Gammaproteobacteria bacterium]|nr:MAG: hypothetical protein DRQ37_04555 [Gammaproteobacteria bacterium]